MTDGSTPTGQTAVQETNGSVFVSPYAALEYVANILGMELGPFAAIRKDPRFRRLPATFDRKRVDEAIEAIATFVADDPSTPHAAIAVLHVAAGGTFETGTICDCTKCPVAGYLTCPRADDSLSD